MNSTIQNGRRALKPVLSLFFIVLAVLFINNRYVSSNANTDGLLHAGQAAQPEEAPRLNEYGIDEARYASFSDEIRSGETFSGILNRNGINASLTEEVLRAAKDVIDVRRIAAGRPITAFQSLDSVNKVDYLVYEPNALEYVVFDFTEGVKVSRHDRQVTIMTKRIAGSIDGSLYGTLGKLNLGSAFGEKLSDLFAHKIDFYRIKKGDKFKVIYEEKYVGDTFVGYGNIKAASFEHAGSPYYAFAFNQNGKLEYYDEDAKSLKNAFLKAPLKFTRISSPYTSRRFHPVLKSYRAHLGTDYAAPTGTPIYAIADGVISNAGYTSANGNYVKIRHNKTYDSGYLHMSKIAPGMKPGVKVTKGQLIGYVGSTGLATGPHLCFRFWKNGQQVDFQNEKLPSSEAIDARYLKEYTLIRDMWKNLIDGMPDDLRVNPDEKPSNIIVASI